MFSPAENAIAYIYIACGCLQCGSVLGGEYESTILPISGGEYKFCLEVAGSYSESTLSCHFIITSPG